jgi:hypothetical protein
MIRWYPISALLIVLLGSAPAWSQDRISMTALNSAIRSQWVQFSLVGGRISLQTSQVGPILPVPNSSKYKDQLSIRTENDETIMNYEWSNAKEQFTVDARGNNCIQLRYMLKSDPEGSTVEFTQKPQEKAVLILGTEGNRRVFAADSVWHLFILYPELSRKHLEPLVQPLLPNWKLADAADSIEKELLRDANNTSGFDRSNWKRWVSQLGDENYARRQAADRALRAVDPVLLVYLQQLDFNRLEAEQQFRIRRIIESILDKINNDSPEQTASWLAGDPAIWLAFLTRPEVSTRLCAAKQLTAFLEGPIPGDPKADPASQKAQLDQLRTLIESKTE